MHFSAPTSVQQAPSFSHPNNVSQVQITNLLTVQSPPIPTTSFPLDPSTLSTPSAPYPRSLSAHAHSQFHTQQNNSQITVLFNFTFTFFTANWKTNANFPRLPSTLHFFKNTSSSVLSGCLPSAALPQDVLPLFMLYCVRNSYK
jgi:hypothetical protein